MITAKEARDRLEQKKLDNFANRAGLETAVIDAIELLEDSVTVMITEEQVPVLTRFCEPLGFSCSYESGEDGVKATISW